jgi:HK97 family phage prohead protease
MSNDVEILAAGTVECRAGSRRIGGYALRFNSTSKPIGGRNGFVERVAPSFINRAKQSGYRGIVARYAHKDEILLGSTESRTLTVTGDSTGLDYTVEVPEYHDWVYQSVRRGDLRSSSFSFSNPVDEWDFQDGMPLRILHEGDIHEVAPVRIGQYGDADCALRSLASHMSAPIEDIQQLSAAGELSRLFVRSDTPRPDVGISGRQALLEVLAAQYPEVRAVDAARVKSGRQALLETMAAAPNVPKPEPTAPVPVEPRPMSREEALAEMAALAPHSGRERLLETLAEQYPPQHRSMADRQLELTYAYRSRAYDDHLASI